MLALGNLKDLTPKRLKADGGVDAWYPYYAGFSSRFAHAALRSLALPENSVVLDPWVGSGTTCVAAARIGLSTVGIDLNPFAVVLAKAKLTGRRQSESLLSVARELRSVLGDETCWGTDANDPLIEWLPRDPALALRGCVQRCFGGELLSAELLNALEPVRALALALLLRSARSLTSANCGSNPTWQRARVLRSVTIDELKSAFEATITGAASTLGTDALLRRGNAQSIRLGDARELPLSDESVDAVLTSPPYCTRVDYAVKTNFELAALGCSSGAELSCLRARLMGTTMLRAPVESTGEFAPMVGALLDRVRNHSSHRSKEYYFPNLRQYFADLTTSIREIKRVLRPSGQALLVVQTSYYKEVEIDLPQLAADIACAEGMTGRQVGSIQIGRVMTSLNPNAKRYLSKRRYVEAVVCLSKS